MSRATTLDLCGVRLLFRWRVWATMRSRITFVARLALYATLAVVLMANWHTWEAKRIWTNGLEVDALARTDVADVANLPVRVVTSRVGGGQVAARLQWRTFDRDGHTVGAGEVESPGYATLQLPDRARLAGVAITAWSPTGEQELLLPLPEPREARLTVDYVGDQKSLAIRAVDRDGTPLRGEVRAAVVAEGVDLRPWDRRSSARTDHAGTVSMLIRTARLDRTLTLLTASLGVLGLSFWIAGELGAWCVGRLVRRGRRVMWQFVGAALACGGLWSQWPDFPGGFRVPFLWEMCPLDFWVLHERYRSLDWLAPRPQARHTSGGGEAQLDVSSLWPSAARFRARVDFHSPTHAGSAELTFEVR
jgi:hypothetical protein